MVFYRWLIVSVLCLLLSACAMTVMTEHLQLGKNQFNDGNYRAAFCQLLPVAVNGYAEAQYAVGYMYYYGYGVSRDTDAGLFWMGKAADQGYRPAMHALALIRRGPVPCVGMERIDSRREIKTFKDFPVSRNIPKATCTPCLEKNTWQKTSIRTLPRISQNNEDLYALQLYGAFQLNHVQTLQKDLDAKQNTRIWHVKNQNKDWYVLTYGSYASIADARLARDELPAQLSTLEPWVRKLNGLQQV